MAWMFSKALMDSVNLHSSLEPVAESSEASCLDGAQFALWSGTSTQPQSSPKDKTTGAWKHSRYGMTYKPLTDDHGQAVLMSFLEASPAKTSASQERAQESTESAAECGNIWRELWVRFDLVSCSWKTHQCLFIEDLDESSVIFPQWGMIRDGVLLERTTSALLTVEKESGFWPTPCLPGNGGSNGKAKLKAMLWPTPDCQNHRDGTKLRKDNNAAIGGRHGMSLHHAVAWPTPTCSRGDYQNSGGKKVLKLSGAVKWSTPTVNDAKNSTMPSSQGDRDSIVGEIIRGGEATQQMGLNPEWVEWLMGWPIGWADLKPLEMDRFRQWQQQHSKY